MKYWIWVSLVLLGFVAAPSAATVSGSGNPDTKPCCCCGQGQQGMKGGSPTPSFTITATVTPTPIPGTTTMTPTVTPTPTCAPGTTPEVFNVGYCCTDSSGQACFGTPLPAGTPTHTPKTCSQDSDCTTAPGGAVCTGDTGFVEHIGAFGGPYPPPFTVCQNLATGNNPFSQNTNGGGGNFDHGELEINANTSSLGSIVGLNIATVEWLTFANTVVNADSRTFNMDWHTWVTCGAGDYITTCLTTAFTGPLSGIGASQSFTLTNGPANINTSGNTGLRSCIGGLQPVGTNSANIPVHGALEADVCQNATAVPASTGTVTATPTVTNTPVNTFTPTVTGTPAATNTSAIGAATPGSGILFGGLGQSDITNGNVGAVFDPQQLWPELSKANPSKATVRETVGAAAFNTSFIGAGKHIDNCSLTVLRISSSPVQSANHYGFGIGWYAAFASDSNWSGSDYQGTPAVTTAYNNATDIAALFASTSPITLTLTNCDGNINLTGTTLMRMWLLGSSPTGLNFVKFSINAGDIVLHVTYH